MARDHQVVSQFLRPLWADITDDRSFFSQRPLVAHYTTTYVLEQIAKHNEIWFSNPLLMNDIDEVRVGIDEGTKHLLKSHPIKESLSPGDFEFFQTYFATEYQRFETEHSFDTYILCLCQHAPDDSDGLLSMWRGYGDSGKGVAIVFAAKEILAAENSPLIISKVVYSTREERQRWFASAAQKTADIIKKNALTGAELQSVASELFQRLRMFALFTKHRGFSEEQEWRLAYLPERDSRSLLRKYLSYFNGPRGIEPKLKLPIAPIPEILDTPFSLEGLVHSIILGPSISSPLAVASMKRMLVSLNRAELAGRVVSSAIPYRSN